MDSAVARRIWRVIVVNDTETGERYMVGDPDHSKVPLPNFSTVIDDAYRIVDFFSAKGWGFRITHNAEVDTYEGCFFRDDNRSYPIISAKTTTMLVCCAALTALAGSRP
jgi:hypothetical protein